MEVTPEEVRRDLQTVKKKINTANVLQKTIDSHESRIKYLKGDDARDARKTITNLTKQMQKAVADMAELENKYMSIILSLKPIYQTVILDYYINGITMWQIANKLHYDERTLYRISGEAVDEIAKLIV